MPLIKRDVIIIPKQLSKEEITRTANILAKFYSANRLTLSLSQRTSIIDVVKLLETMESFEEKENVNNNSSMLFRSIS